MRRSHSYQRVTIVAGEPEFHCWCNVCGTPTRVRIPLLIGATVASHLEICPGCGTGHDRPSVTVTAAPRERRQGHLLARLTRTIHGWACRRRGLLPRACAFGDCQWPGLYRNEHAIPADDGTWRYLFCTKRHRRSWAADYGLRLDREVGAR